jgi:LuxR family transcriptional regulator, maltose regulon positive regulatory protein
MKEKRQTDEEIPAFPTDRKTSDPLLKTKLFIPRLRQELVPRMRLVERLNQGTKRSLTLVSAPAGFGKTTVLAEWAAQSPLPVAWLSLAAGDNEPVRFLSYLVAAITGVANGMGTEALALLDSPQPYPPPLIAANLLSNLEILPHPIALVLDDYHVLNEPSVHATLAFLLDQLPPQLRLVIATRADPPIPLSRLRVLGELKELRADDLRFTAGETALFLNQVMGLDLSEEDIAALEARTEGWIAGLQMAALSMQGHKDLANFVQAFSGSHRFILDYLLEEVISRQQEEVQRFLLQTSILERLTSPLCDAMYEVEGRGASGMVLSSDSQDRLSPTSIKGSQEILEHLERSNLFLTPLDDERRWYRYHHLFADLLRARLQQAEPGLVPKLHLKAAGWYEQNGFIAEAVRHAFAAREYERAADLIEGHGQRRWSLSDIEFMSLVGKLPVEVLHARPSLGIYHAWSLFISGQYEATEMLLSELLKHIPPADQNPEALWMRSFVNLLLVYIAEMSGKEPADELPDRQALEFVPEHHLGMRNSADVLYTYLLDQRGEFAASEELLLRTVRRDMAANGTTAVPICISRLARNWVLQGRLKEAADLCRKHIDYVQERGENRFFIAGNLHLVLSGIMREWNDLDEAEQLIEAGLQANEPWRLPQVNLVEHMAKARLLQARGDLDEALATLDQLDREILGKSIAPDLVSDLRALKVKLWLAKGDREKAWEFAGLSQPVETLDFRHELDHILLARMFLSEGRLVEALDLLERIAWQADTGGRSGRLLEIRLLEALTLAGKKRIPQAFEKLEACLALAEPESYLRVFLDEGEMMQKLLSAYLRAPAPAHASYAGRIFKAFSPTGSDPARIQDEIIEPLTRREMEVLRLICAGDSNQDIAENLNITMSTVKKHTGNIFSKLGVSSRTQAIARARPLNLFPPES